MLPSNGAGPHWKKDLQEDVKTSHLYNELRYLILNMKLIGGWPVRYSAQRGFEPAPRLSLPILWSYALVLLEGVLLTACLKYSFALLLHGHLPFIEKVILALHIMYQSIPAFIPLIHWHTGPGLAKYFNAWADLQCGWAEVTGTPLRSDLGRVIRWSGIAIFIWAVVVPAYHMVIIPDMFAWKVPVYSLVVLQLLTQCVLWGALNKEVASAAVKLSAHVRRSLQKGRGACPGSVRGCCMLWLRLRSLTQGLGSAWGFVMIHCLFIVTLMGMTASFGLLAAIRMHVLRRCISTFVTVMAAVFICNSTCSNVEHAVKSVFWKVGKEVLSTPLHGLRMETAEEVKVMRFASVIQYKPVRFTLSGFVTLNRRFVVSIASIVSTYIVVLAQLAIALQSEDDAELQL